MDPGCRQATKEESDDKPQTRDIDENGAGPLRIALNDEHVDGDHGAQEAEEDQEQSEQDHGPVNVGLACVAENETTSNTGDEGNDHVEQAKLGLTNAVAASGHHVVDLFSEWTRDEERHDRGEHKRDHGETCPLEFPTLCKQGEGTELLSCLGRNEEDAVCQDRPHYCREESRLESVQHGNSGVLPFEAGVENADVGPQVPSAISGVVEPGTVLSWRESLLRLSSWRTEVVSVMSVSTETGLTILPSISLDLVKRVSGRRAIRSSQEMTPRPEVA